MVERYIRDVEVASSNLVASMEETGVEFDSTLFSYRKAEKKEREISETVQLGGDREDER